MMHYSVLKSEVLDSLNIKEDGIYVDATLGYAGISKEILKRTKRGFLFAFDQDEEAVKYSDNLLSQIGNNYKILHTNFINMKESLEENDISLVDGIVFDLGLSSPEIDNSDRGFSFMNDARLDMRMDKRQELDAHFIVNNYDFEKLKDIFFTYGEEKFSKSIASNIIKYRNEKSIDTTLELVDIIKKSVPFKYYLEHHPERQIFQAIRIEVNSELTVLNEVLPDAIKLLKSGGRLSVITFHSLEDRIVKQIFKKYSEVDSLVKGLPSIPPEYEPLIKLVNKKPILPSDKELGENSRSKSAKLRIVERV